MAARKLRKVKPDATLRILGRIYEVYFRTVEEMPDDLAGVNFELRHIYMRPNIGSKQDLLHELIEIANYELELNLSHPKIKSLENFLFAVLSDNHLAFWDQTE